jgi:hypothetical protein
LQFLANGLASADFPPHIVTQEQQSGARQNPHDHVNSTSDVWNKIKQRDFIVILLTKLTLIVIHFFVTIQRKFGGSTMAVEEAFKGSAGKGLAIGIGVAILAPLVLPAVATAARPLARAAIKTGMIFYEKSRETMAEFGEVVEDLVAEARADMEQSHVDEVAEAERIIEQTAADADEK